VIVVDTSALLAIILREPGHERATASILAAEAKTLPASVLLEAVMVLSRFETDPRSTIDAHVASLGLGATPIDAEIVRVAQQAFLTFGKGRHPARLNFGDCQSYATAKYLRAPLLYVGNDFAQTDIRAA